MKSPEMKEKLKAIEHRDDSFVHVRLQMPGVSGEAKGGAILGRVPLVGESIYIAGSGEFKVTGVLHIASADLQINPPSHENPNHKPVVATAAVLQLSETESGLIHLLPSQHH